MFFFVVISLENFSWLVPATQYIIPGLVKTSDLGVCAALFWIILVFIECKNTKSKKMSWLPGLYVLVVICSAFVASKMFGQGVFITIRQNRYLLISLLLYYPIRVAVDCNKLKKNDLVKIFLFQAKIETVLFILQYILINKFVFIYADIQTRFGEARLRVPFLMSLLLVYYCTNEWMNGRSKCKNIVWIIMGASVLILLCKHRAPSLIMMATFIIAYYLWKKNLSKKIFMGAIFLVFLVALISNSSLFQDSINVITNTGGIDTLSIRNAGQLYYLEKIVQSPLFGFAIPNDSCSAAVAASGQPYNLLLADNGIFGYLYINGLVGVVWLVFLFISLFKQALTIYKLRKNYFYLLYVFFEIGNIYMGMHWYYYYAFPFVLFISMLNIDYLEVSK